jgi:hypothetical protein
MSDRTTKANTTPQEPEAPPEPPSGLPQYAVTIEQFASSHAWRVNGMGDVVPALELMGGFVYQMRQVGRNADTTENYLRDWVAFRDS